MLELLGDHLYNKVPNESLSGYKNHVECVSIDEIESIVYDHDDLLLEALITYVNVFYHLRIV